METQAALKLLGLVRATYTTWFRNKSFAELYKKLPELAKDYKLEAIQLLRRDNQLDAVLLESKIIAEMKREIEIREYDLIRTNLAREVYSKLISDLDFQPKTLALTWEQKISQLYTNPQIEQGEIVDGESEVIEESSSKELRGDVEK